MELHGYYRNRKSFLEKKWTEAKNSCKILYKRRELRGFFIIQVGRKGIRMISSISNNRIKQVVQWQNRARERKEAGIFIAEGIKMFEEAPKEWIREAYVSDKFLSQHRNGKDNLLLQKKLQEIRWEKVSEEVFQKISDTQTPQGILCVLKRPVYTWEDITSAQAGKKPLLVVLEELQDPGNLGTILRAGEGAGVSGILLSTDCVDLYNPKTIRSTMGSIYRVPHLYVEDMPSAIRKLGKQDIHTYAAHLEGKNYYNAFDFTKGTAFLIGNEGKGLKKETADLAQSYVKIPMEGHVESLNAAIASSLLMYEAHRQRFQ